MDREALRSLLSNEESAKIQREIDEESAKNQNDFLTAPSTTEALKIIESYFEPKTSKSKGRPKVLRGELTPEQEQECSRLLPQYRQAYHKMRTQKWESIRGYYGREVTAMLVALQSNKCAFCDRLLDEGVVIDHNHTTGYVRAAVHSACNILIGYVEKLEERLKISPNEIIELIGKYLSRD